MDDSYHLPHPGIVDSYLTKHGEQGEAAWVHLQPAVRVVSNSS